VWGISKDGVQNGGKSIGAVKVKSIEMRSYRERDERAALKGGRLL
jgi:hypothetical protein